LCILEESSENAMIDIEKFRFDNVSNVSNWINLNYLDSTAISLCKRNNRM
jgi:hypothetical protein